MGSNVIRNMHDAIDLLVSRASGSIREKEHEETESVRIVLENELGIPSLRSEYLRLFGCDMPIYNGKGIYQPMLDELVRPIRAKYSHVHSNIRRIAEDAHVKTVAGDKGALLESLQDQLDKLINSKPEK